MKLFFMVSLILASLNYVCGDVMVTDGQVTRLNVEHWKGTWAAPGGNFIEKLKIKVKSYKIVNPTESDAKIIKAIESGEHFEVFLASRASTYSADHKDYNYLVKHHVPFSKRVFPRLNFIGLLKWHITNNSEYNDDSKSYEPITQILIYNPSFESKWGSYRNPRLELLSSSRKIHIFNQLYE